jgi:hypothetical protein
MKKLVLIVVLLLLTSTIVSAFDGNRKGFILGFGIGPGYTSYTETLEFGNSSASGDESGMSIDTDFKIGYAPSELLQIYWMSKVAWFSQEVVVTDIFGNILAQEDFMVSSGIGGIGVSYYFQPLTPSPYILGGLGISIWDYPFEEGTSAMTGFGMTFGGGYEFSRHWSVEGVLTYGQSKDDIGFGITHKYDVLSIKFTINGLLY